MSNPYLVVVNVDHPLLEGYSCTTVLGEVTDDRPFRAAADKMVEVYKVKVSDTNVGSGDGWFNQT